MKSSANDSETIRNNCDALDEKLNETIELNRFEYVTFSHYFSLIKNNNNYW